MNQLQDCPLGSGQCMAVIFFGQSIANSLGAKGASFAVGARNAEDGISFLQSRESLLLEMVALTTRLRELGIQYANKDLLTTTDEVMLLMQKLSLLVMPLIISPITLNLMELS